MAMLPVHCCCEPSKRLGYVLAPDRVGRINFSWMECFPTSLRLDVVQPPPTRHEIHTTVESLHYNGEHILAVKSAHQPIETWRKVPGFVEVHSL